jgi:hypothetical protein
MRIRVNVLTAIRDANLLLHALGTNNAGLHPICQLLALRAGIGGYSVVFHENLS